jgi:RNA polymerase sigma factor (TIGR02999 family)
MLIDHARTRCALKRVPQELPAGANEFTALLNLTEKRAAELIALDDALSELAAISARQAEIVEMRYFAGLTVEETAAAFEISPATVKREWEKARAWLHARMRGLEV